MSISRALVIAESDWSASVPACMSVASTRKRVYIVVSWESQRFTPLSDPATGTLALQSGFAALQVGRLRFSRVN